MIEKVCNNVKLGESMMYIPKHFRLEDETFIEKFIEEHSCATLISQHNGVPYATHLPLVWKKSERALYGHFAKKNEQWQDIQNQTVLAIFHDPHCYISASWYETGQAVSTWNYVSVHMYVELEFMNDEKEIYDSLDELTKKYEGEGSPHQLSYLDRNFLMGMMKGIVPFRIKVQEIQAKGKLSQNHSLERQKRVIRELEKSQNQHERTIGRLMKENIRKNER